jgi:hypothetical protein
MTTETDDEDPQWLLDSYDMQHENDWLREQYEAAKCCDDSEDDESDDVLIQRADNGDYLVFVRSDTGEEHTLHLNDLMDDQERAYCEEPEPGARLDSFLQRVLSVVQYERVFGPIISDMRIEHADATSCGNPAKAYGIVVRCHCSVAWAWLLQIRSNWHQLLRKAP